MDNCFRFFVNIDKCFNMSIYDMFFYKLQNREKIKINHVQTAATEGEKSLSYAVSDIRTYLNKYPYHVKEYQFIFVMRHSCKQERIWENSLLYRLVQINYELRKENICMDVSGRTDRALNLIMLNETDLSKRRETMEDYLSSSQLKHDIELFFDSLNIDCSKTCLAAIEEALETHADSMKKATRYLISSFVEYQKEVIEQMQLNEGCCNENIVAAFVNFLGQLLSNYRVFEVPVNSDQQQDPRGNTEALLRIVEYINSSFEHQDNVLAKESLSTRCVKVWKRVLNEDDIERKYAEMLFRFREELNNLQVTLETTEAPIPSKAELPVVPDEKDIEITDEEEKFIFARPEDDKKGKKNNALKEVINEFMSQSLTVSGVEKGWKKAYSELKVLTKDLEFSLEELAGRLSSGYSQKVEERKREALKWEKEIYFATKKDKEEKRRIKQKKDQYLDELKQPHMRPYLRLEDLNNFINCLDNKNSEIEKYTKCLSFVTFGRFMLFVLFVIVCMAIHYAAIQPFVFNGGQSLVVFLAVLCATFFLTGIAWLMPRRHFIKKIRNAVEDINNAIDGYMRSYIRMAENFHRYINVLNLLDCYSVYYNIYDQADERSGRLSREHLWHKLAVKDLLAKVNAFDGLIRHCCDCEPDGLKKAEIVTLFSLDDDNAKEPSDYAAYWLQG